MSFLQNKDKNKHMFYKFKNLPMNSTSKRRLSKQISFAVGWYERFTSSIKNKGSFRGIEQKFTGGCPLFSTTSDVHLNAKRN